MRWLGASWFHACQALHSVWGKLFTSKRGGGSGRGSRQRLREWSRSDSLPQGPHAPRKAEATDHLQSKVPTLSKTFLGERGLCTRSPWGAGEALCLAPALLLGVTGELCGVSCEHTMLPAPTPVQLAQQLGACLPGESQLYVRGGTPSRPPLLPLLPAHSQDLMDDAGGSARQAGGSGPLTHRG